MKMLTSLALAAGLAMTLSTAANASTEFYDFTVNVTTGPLAPETVHGSLAFDSSNITPGAQNNSPSPLTQFDFTFNGVTDHASDVTTYALDFDASGVLDNATMVGSNWGMKQGEFLYGDFVGTVTFTQVTGGGAPEPAMWAMLLAGFFGIGAMARHVRQRIEVPLT